MTLSLYWVTSNSRQYVLTTPHTTESATVTVTYDRVTRQVDRVWLGGKRTIWRLYTPEDLQAVVAATACAAPTPEERDAYA